SREEEGKVTVTTTGFSPMIVATVQSSSSQGNIGDTLDGDYAYLTDVKMVADETTESGYSMRTGTSPWDDDDEAGNDSGDTNNVLRTYDIATYTVTFTSKVREDAPYKVYKEGTLYFEFLLEGTSSEVQYETLSMGWLSAKKDARYVITEETMEKEDGSTATCQVLRGSYTWEPSEDNDHAIGESTQELTLAIRALALTNGTIIQPQFTFFLEGNEVGVDYADWGTESYSDGILTGSQALCPEHGEAEYQTVTPPEVTVSAAASYNVKIISASTSKCQSVGTFDFGTGNELALNQGAGSVYGRMGAYGIVIQITGKSGQGLRGVELPKSGEDITFDLSLASTFTYVDEDGNTIVLSLDDGTLDSAYMPL
ncbi:MAG: hypothetical protein LUC83_10115, partial [Clostridiales bacterium]|nr:hypothetical protein [Clostridiales bacterium]